MPLLVLDLWEHADHLQHESVEGNRVEAFWKLVARPDVAERSSSVRTLDPVL